MKILIVFLCIVACCNATFFNWLQHLYTNQSSPTQEAVQLCVYSKDADAYKPNCYKCPKPVYSSALMACLNATTMPSNISYASATCLEKNCDINYPTPAPKNENVLPNFFQQIEKLVRLGRSISDNKVDMPLHIEQTESDIMSDFQILQRIESYASDFELDYIDQKEL